MRAGKKQVADSERGVYISQTSVNIHGDARSTKIIQHNVHQVCLTIGVPCAF